MSEVRETITDLNIYPIKSAQAATVDGDAIKSLAVGRTGLQAYDIHDREFLVVDADPVDDNTHLFVSQRGWDERGRLNAGRKDDRLLATVQTDISEIYLTISSIVGVLKLPTEHNESGSRYDVRVHSSTMWNAIDQGDEPAGYFSELLGRPVRLARDGRLIRRLVAQEHRREFSSNAVAAADGFPFLLVSEASLRAAHEANGLEPGSVPIGQYRGNIAIAGDLLHPWGEDYLRQIRIGGTILDVEKACSRCPIPNINQVTGERDIKGLRILRGHNGFGPDDTKPLPMFGQNLNHHYMPGQFMKVGDIMQVLLRVDKPNFRAA